MYEHQYACARVNQFVLVVHTCTHKRAYTLKAKDNKESLNNLSLAKNQRQRQKLISKNLILNIFRMRKKPRINCFLAYCVARFERVYIKDPTNSCGSNYIEMVRCQAEAIRWSGTQMLDSSLHLASSSDRVCKVQTPNSFREASQTPFLCPFFMPGGCGSALVCRWQIIATQGLLLWTSGLEFNKAIRGRHWLLKPLSPPPLTKSQLFWANAWNGFALTEIIQTDNEESL